MANESFDVVIVGGGMGGLNLAALLTNEGRRVLVLERGGREQLGGRAASGKIGNAAIDHQRSAVCAAHMALDSLYGLGADADREYADRIAAVGPDDVLRVARRVIDLDAYTLAVIKP